MTNDGYTHHEQFLANARATLAADGAETALGQALAYALRDSSTGPAAAPSAVDRIFELADTANDPKTIKIRLEKAEKELEAAKKRAKKNPDLYGQVVKLQTLVDSLRGYRL